MMVSRQRLESFKMKASQIHLKKIGTGSVFAVFEPQT